MLYRRERGKHPFPFHQETIPLVVPTRQLLFERFDFVMSKVKGRKFEEHENLSRLTGNVTLNFSFHHVVVFPVVRCLLSRRRLLSESLLFLSTTFLPNFLSWKRSQRLVYFLSPCLSHHVHTLKKSFSYLIHCN